MTPPKRTTVGKQPSRTKSQTMSISELRAATGVRPLRDVLKDEILKALNKTFGDIPLAGWLLGIGKTTIYRKLKENKVPFSRVQKGIYEYIQIGQTRHRLKLGERDHRIKLSNAERQKLLWKKTEKREILKACKKAKGDQRMAAALLGVGLTTIYRKLKAYELQDRTKAH